MLGFKKIIKGTNTSKIKKDNKTKHTHPLPIKHGKSFT